MSGSRPQRLLLRDAPAAVLLLELPAHGGDAVVLAADDGAAHLAGVGADPSADPGAAVPPGPPADLPADLPGFCRAAGLPAQVAARALAVPVPGEPVAGRWWLVVAPVDAPRRAPDGARRALLSLHAVEGAPVAPGAAVALVPGAALLALPSAAEAQRGCDGEVEWVDAAFTRVTGVAAAAARGAGPSRLLPGGEADRSGLRGAVLSGRAVSATVPDERADGTRFLHRVRATPLRERSGAVRRVVTWHADVTAPGRAGAAADPLRALDALAAPALTREAVVTGLGATVRALTGTVARAALVALADEPHARGGSTEVEVVAAAGEPFEGLLGRVWRRPPGARGDDPLLEAPGPGGPRLRPLAGGAPGSASAWLERLTSPAGPGVSVVALPGRGHVLGWLVVVPGEDAVVGEDGAVLRAAAHRAGLAVENARLHAREHELSETLQRSMLPEDTAVEGLDVWAFYAPNADHAQVGGDWYDVLRAPDGSAGVVIGDVVGHDVEAVAAMGQMRSVVRSAAQELDDPGSVLMRVDQLAAGVSIPRMASLVYATLQRLDDGGWEVAWSSAGHLPPLLRRAGGGTGVVEVLSDATGTLVGLGERPRPTRERALRPGDVLVFYTDGLIEARHRPMRDGMEVLVELLAASRAHDAAGIGEELLQGLGESPEDDTAIVVVRVPEEVGEPAQRVADTPRRRRWQLPSEPSSVGKARHATLRACAVWGLGVGPQAEIVVSELVANAVLHGWGPVGLRLFDLPGALRVEVEDDSPEHPRVVQARPDGAGGHGMRVVATLGRWGVTPTRRGKIVWVEVPTSPPAAPA
ncbi:ATP-binding SpoIIE family protein phosphatase [Kineococcus sp. SYSU DK005]|uniref:ATP-binding SpoIIE family protein phosphatase n=1 Tax=Kineococcus sp. SYSU DK005 TaxID=3383126 RepID=UPI003D7F05D9